MEGRRDWFSSEHTVQLTPLRSDPDSKFAKNSKLVPSQAVLYRKKACLGRRGDSGAMTAFTCPPLCEAADGRATASGESHREGRF